MKKILSVALLILGFLLLVVGSVISSSGYGLAIPDWPLAQGRLVPPHLVGGIAWEFTHRVLALCATLLAVALWAALGKRSDPMARRLSGAAAAVIVIQVVVGGIGVLQEFPWLHKVLHASLSHLFVGLAAAVAALLCESGLQKASSVDPSSLRRIRAFTSMVLLQIVAGAVVRHADSRGTMMMALLLHVLLAVGVVVAGLSTGFRLAPVLSGWRSKACYGVVGGVIIQVLLGVTVLLQIPMPDDTGQASLSYIWHSAAHILVGGFLLAAGSALYVSLRRSISAV